MHKLIIILLSASLIAFSTAAATPANRMDKKPAPKKTLRVLYWNIQNGMWCGQEDNYDQFVEWINKKNPDICIFAEAGTIYYTGTKNEMPDSLRYLPRHWGELAARYGHEYWFMGAKRDNYPQVITSRYPIDSVARFVGVRPDTVVAHGCGWARIQLEGMRQPLNIVCCHLRPFGYGYHVPKERRKESSANYEGDQHRRKEAMWILRHTVGTSEDPTNEFWLMAGDFNSRSRKDNFHYKYSDAAPSFMVQDFMMSAESPYYDIVAESFRNMWCPSHVNNSRIDFVYVTKPLLDACKDVDPFVDSYTNAVRSEVSSNFWIPSDHHPIIVDFNLAKLK